MKEPFKIKGIRITELKENIRIKQIEIALAYRSGNKTKAYKLAEKLIQERQAQILAVHRVVTNKGVRSAGIKEKPVKTNKQYYDLVERIGEIINNVNKYRAKPLRRIHIESPPGRIRPLSIPSYVDRCLQALFLIAIDPIVEDDHDVYSYGFRPYKNPHWAIGNLGFLLSNTRPNVQFRYAIKVDIRKCFDMINQDFLKAKTPVIPLPILHSWLNCGYIDLKISEKVEPTGIGVPQGGIISPLLANLALNGIQRYLQESLKIVKNKGGASVVRFADDLVVLCRNKETVILNLENLKKFLNLRGLEINETKTKVVDIEYDTLNFVGFEIKKVHRENRKTQTIFISIPKSAIRKLKNKLRGIFKTPPHTRKSIANCIFKSNPIIRGWAQYYSFAYDAHFVMNKLEYWIWKLYYFKLMKVYKNQYPKLGRWELNRKIRHNTNFFDKITQWPQLKFYNKELKLFKPTSIKQRAPQFTHQGKNPYVPDDLEKIAKINLQMKTRWHKKILKKYKCGLCGENLYKNHLKYELHHIIPLKYKGSNKTTNIVPLCPDPCHKDITSAVARQNKEECLYFENRGVLKIPPQDLKHFK